MGKYFRWLNRPAIISLSVIAVIAAATAAAFVSLNRTVRPDNAGPPPSPSLPPPSTPPAVNAQGFPVSSPTAGCANPVPLRQANGAWILGYNDDKQATSPVPSAAGKLGLLDFDWLSFTSPGTLAQSDSFAQSLPTVLSTAAQVNPCTLRFVTINDSSTPLRVMAQILTQPSVMDAHVAAIAKLMAGEPYATGLTLDYEFALPRTTADLAVYAQVAGWHNLSFAQEVNQLTNDYTRLVQMVAVAMHRQHRYLRVACLVRNNDVVASEPNNVAPYLFDYGKLSTYADQLVLMAVDFHYSTGDPGPIAPLASVKQVVGYVRSYGMPAAKLAIEVPNYAYDWQVNAKGGIATSASGAVIPASTLTPTQVAAAMKSGHWRQVGKQDGETEYAYTATVSGKSVRHIVWDASTGLLFEKGQLAKLLPGSPINIWQIGNNDPVGTTLAVQAR